MYRRVYHTTASVVGVNPAAGYASFFFFFFFSQEIQNCYDNIS